MFFIFALVCIQSIYIFVAAPADAGDRKLVVHIGQEQVGQEINSPNELSRMLKQMVSESEQQDLVRPKQGVAFTTLDNKEFNDLQAVQALRVAMRLCMSQAAEEEREREHSKIESFYTTKLQFVQENLPDSLPYFNRDILAFLGRELESVAVLPQDKELFEIKLWKIFLDAYSGVFKPTYLCFAARIAQDSIDPFIVGTLKHIENDLYIEILKKALKESASEGALEYEQSIDALTGKSKDVLAKKIYKFLDAYVKSELEKYRLKYSRYSPDKTPKWVAAYITKNPKEVYKDPSFLTKLYLPKVLSRVAYDITQVSDMSIYGMKPKSGDDCDDMEEIKNKLMLSAWYKDFYADMLKDIYKEFNEFGRRHGIHWGEEKLLELFSDVFEIYPYNIFHVNEAGELATTREFGRFFMHNVMQNINQWVEELKKTDSDKYRELPMFAREAESSELKKAQEAMSQRLEKAQQNKQYQHERVLGIQEEKAASHTQAITAFAKKQEEERQRQEKIQQNKRQRQEEERKKREQAEQEELERKKRELERNKALDKAAKELHLKKDKQLECLHKKRIALLDLEEHCKQLGVIGKIKNDLTAVHAKIEEQQKLLSTSTSKNLKKILEDFESQSLVIDGLMTALEEKSKTVPAQDLDTPKDQQDCKAADDQGVFSDKAATPVQQDKMGVESDLAQPALSDSGISSIVTQEQVDAQKKKKRNSRTLPHPKTLGSFFPDDIDSFSGQSCLQDQCHQQPQLVEALCPAQKGLMELSQLVQQQDFVEQCLCLHKNPAVLGAPRECVFCKNKKNPDRPDPFAAKFAPEVVESSFDFWPQQSQKELSVAFWQKHDAAKHPSQASQGHDQLNPYAPEYYPDSHALGGYQGPYSPEPYPYDYAPGYHQDAYNAPEYSPYHYAPEYHQDARTSGYYPIDRGQYYDQRHFKNGFRRY